MTVSLILAMLLMEQSPRPLTETQSRDIGCVAVLSIIAEEQKRDAPGANDYLDIRETGPRWAAIVGNRISVESGQSQEAVRTKVQDAVSSEQLAVRELANPKAYVDDRMVTCLALMQAELESQTAAQ